MVVVYGSAQKARCTSVREGDLEFRVYDNEDKSEFQIVRIYRPLGVGIAPVRAYVRIPYSCTEAVAKALQLRNPSTDLRR